MGYSKTFKTVAQRLSIFSYYLIKVEFVTKHIIIQLHHLALLSRMQESQDRLRSNQIQSKEIIDW